MAFEIKITDKNAFATPQGRVLAVESAAKAVAVAAGEDAADSVMMLLTAAVHLTMQGGGSLAPSQSTNPIIGAQDEAHNPHDIGC